MEREYRKNGQVVQPNVANVPDNNGWPEPLTDTSNPIKHTVSIGRLGESKNIPGDKTAQDARHLPEGSYGGSNNDGSGEVLRTTQQKKSEHHRPEGA